MSLTARQQEAIEAFRSGQFLYHCSAGSTGSGKTFNYLALLNLLCLNISDVRFAVIRKSETNLKQTTIPSFEIMKHRTSTQDASKRIGMSMKYRNGSEILFTWADITKDADLNRVKGLEVTGALIEEANEIDERYFHILKTRIGRWNNHKCPQFILLTLNPSYGWVKDIFYDPYKAGTLQKPHFFLEYEVDDNKDNLTKEYVKGLEDLPKEEYQRFVKNNWEYVDNPAQLIQYAWLKNVLVDEDDHSIELDYKGRDQIICDPADDGSDRTVIAGANNNFLHTWRIKDKEDPVQTGEVILMKSYEKKFTTRQSDVVIDGIGVGAGTVGALRRGMIMRAGEHAYKIRPKIFKSNHAAVNNGKYFEGFLEFVTARDEGGWMLRELIRNEDIKIRNTDGLVKEMLGAEFQTDNRKLSLVQKKITKRKLGNISPDLFDTCLMWAWNYLTNPWTGSSEFLSSMTSDLDQLNRNPSNELQGV